MGALPEYIKGLGITKFGHRKVLHSNIQKLMQNVNNDDNKKLNNIDQEGANAPLTFV